MIARKKKICKECNKEDYIFSKGRCKSCAQKSYAKKQPKKTPLKKRFKPSGQLIMFDMIWNIRERVSFLSGRKLQKYEETDFYPNLFAHVLNKGYYTYWKLNDKNIILLHPTEHMLLDAGTEGQRKAYAQEWGCDWGKIHNLKDTLKTEYRELYG